MIQNKRQTQFLFIATGLLVVLSFFIAKPFLSPLIFAAIFAIVLQPVFLFLKKNFYGNGTIAAFLTLASTLLIIVPTVSILLLQLLTQVENLYQSVIQSDTQHDFSVRFFTSLGASLDSFIPGLSAPLNQFSLNIVTYEKDGLVWLMNHIGVGISSISLFIVSSMLFLLGLYYMLLEGQKVQENVIQLSPLEKKDTLKILTRLKESVYSVFVGSLLVSILHGIFMIALGFWIFGVPNAILWGVLTFITALIPGIGAALVQVPGIIYLLVIGKTSAALGLTIFGFSVALFIDNVIRPRLIGRKLALPPLVVLVSVLGGVAFFGVVGIFLGPLTFTLCTVLYTTYRSIAVKD